MEYLEFAVGGVIGLLVAAGLGLLVGALAKLLMPGPDPGGWITTSLLGIAGSWIGSLTLGSMGLHGITASVVGAVLGAMLLLAIPRILRALE